MPENKSTLSSLDPRKLNKGNLYIDRSLYKASSLPAPVPAPYTFPTAPSTVSVAAVSAPDLRIGEKADSSAGSVPQQTISDNGNYFGIPEPVQQPNTIYWLVGGALLLIILLKGKK